MTAFDRFGKNTFPDDSEVNLQMQFHAKLKVK